MAVSGIMIGMMKCSMGGVECGSVKTASVSVKPNFKEHKTGYPQISDLKAVIYCEGLCKVDTEESALAVTSKSIAKGLSSGTPIEIDFEGKAPGLGGTALTIAGTGFGSGAGLFGKMEDFGYVSAETTCLELSFTGAGAGATGNTVGGVPFITPEVASQAVTIDKDTLLYGAPTVNGSICTQAQFTASSKTRYLAMSWPPVLDAAILESSDFEINASYASGEASDLAEVTANMVSGSVPTPKGVSMTVPLIGGGTVGISMDGIVGPDLTFNPGNDWNGIAVIYRALLTDITKVGTNWANIN